MKIIYISQRSDSWKAFRKTHIGATDAAVIIGISPWKTPLQLWEEKVFGKKEEMNNAMIRGVELEGKARRWAENHFGVALYDKVVQSDEYPWAIASLDGISEDNKILVEIKCPGEKAHSLAKEGKYSDTYHAQVQHQMMVTGCSKCHYISYDGIEGVVIPIARDDKFIEEMIDLEIHFLHMMRCLIAPEPTDADFMPRLDSLWDRRAKEWLEAKKVLVEAKKVLTEAETVEFEAKQHLIEISRDYNSIGGGIKMQKITRKGNVQYSDIPELEDIDLEQYRKPPTEYWKIQEIN